MPAAEQRLALLDSIISANKKKPGQYTDATADRFKAALSEAVLISKNEYATAKQVVDATLALKEAQADLVPKSANRLTVKGKTVPLKAASLKKRSAVIKKAKAVTTGKADGKVTYSLKSVTRSSFRKYFKVAKSGSITVKKGLKKGKYILKIKVTASGDADHSKGVKTATVTVKVR